MPHYTFQSITKYFCISHLIGLKVWLEIVLLFFLLLIIKSVTAAPAVPVYLGEGQALPVTCPIGATINEATSTDPLSACKNMLAAVIGVCPVHAAPPYIDRTMEYIGTQTLHISEQPSVGCVLKILSYYGPPYQTAPPTLNQGINGWAIPKFYCPGINAMPTNRQEWNAFPQSYYPFNCPESQVLTLVPEPGQQEPRPAGAEGDGGKSTYKMIAKVTEGGSPKAGMNLTFKVDVVGGSGGHPTAPNRPKGNVPSAGTTDLNGEVKLTFTATAFAGSHTVTAICSNCTPSNLQKELSFDVKVPGLSPFRADTQQPARWSFIGLDRYHGNNRFYLTATASDNLKSLISAIQAVRWALAGSKIENQSWGQVGINDASLIWGGRYPGDPAKTDAAGNLLPLPTYPWTGTNFHAGHRLGVEVDLQTRLQSKPNRKRIYEAICAIDEEDLPPSLLYHYDKGPHFHAYLLGNIDQKLGGNDCWESAK